MRLRFILPLLILILAAFLRLYNLPEVAIFTFDEEHQTTMAKTIVNNFHLIWIGVSASNLEFYLGPFWVYFTAFWLWLSNGDPLITNYVAVFIGIVTTFAVYYVATKIFSFRVGIIASFLYATLPLFIFFDQKYLTPTLVPLLSLLLFYSLYRTFDSDSWWIIFTFLFGLVFHTHLSIFPYGLLAGVLFIKQLKIIKKKVIILSIVVFLTMISPLLIFDYFHNFSNITAPLRIKELTASSNSADLSSRFSYFLESLGRIWYLKPGLANADEIPFACGTIFKDTFPNYDFESIRTRPFFGFSLLSLAVLVWFLVRPKTWEDLSSRMLALSIIAIAGAFLFFHGGPFEYYLLGLFPFVLIIFGYLITNLPKKIFMVSLVFVGLVSISGINTILNINKSYGLQVKKELITQVMSVIKNEPFELQNNGVCHQYDGWRYLFTVYGRRPEKSNTDQSLGWLYSNEITENPVTYRVIMSEGKILPTVDISKAVIMEKGGFKAYILDENRVL